MSAMQELNEKLAKWAGFKFVQLSDGMTGTADLGVTWPDGQEHGYVPDFCNDLNAWFKWLSPKCGEWRLEKYGEDKFGSKFCANVYLGWDYWEHGFERAESPAVALCKAIEKVLEAV